MDFFADPLRLLSENAGVLGIAILYAAEFIVFIPEQLGFAFLNTVLVATYYRLLEIKESHDLVRMIDEVEKFGGANTSA